jgi:DNA-binding transcriptional regulator LsrR (DeoR family)
MLTCEVWIREKEKARAVMTRTDELRLMTKVARLYYERGMQQAEIANILCLSQSTVSRVIKRAHDEKIVRTTIDPPKGVYADLEDRLVQAFGLKDAVVADATLDDDEVVIRDIGSAAAYYLETSLKSGEVIGISSWSATLLAMVDAMHPVPGLKNIRVVQILGGVGNPTAEMHATRLVSRLGQLLHGGPVYLPAPGVVGSIESRMVLLADPFIQASMELINQVTIALVGIGEIKPSSLLSTSGNVFSPGELESLRRQGAVGDILVRFFDRQGHPVESPLNDRVVGMGLEQLQRLDRSVGIAGGRRKVEAIHAALNGKLINVLITDHFSAERLLT